MKKEQYQLKSLAIELLACLNNLNPAPQHIALMQALLIQNPHDYLTFHQRLTPREITCLFLAALGNTSQQTATLLKLAPGTIESHRKALKRKLSCYSLAHAVFIGMRYGYITNGDMAH